MKNHLRFRPFVLLFSALAACLPSLPAADAPSAASAAVWPAVGRENKPWTRWWWPGSAVDKASLTQQLEKFAAAGLGGVEVTPIYGANGYEARYIDFLSPKWMEMLEHTGKEAKRLGLGLDMATGTGWPFGGPWIDEAHGSQKITLKDGQLSATPTAMKVKRAAPGDEGLVIDPYSTAALNQYLAPFDKAFANFPRDLVRSQFHDSFEYYEAGWTPELPRVFEKMHGYDIQKFATAIMAAPAAANVDADTLGRVKSDYRETLAQLHLDYLHRWVEWSHDHGWLVRNQSHGAPGNLLDLYANADVAETEVFGSTPFPIPGLRRAEDEVRHDQDLPESLVIRMASSASHVAGHPFASSETCTWLRDHWKVSLAYTKPEIDRLFTDGINHIFYHGTVFSPSDAPWPGWLFYASTQFNPNNPWWDDFGALNRYVGRVQSVLQRGTPDNDILLYWPFADALDDPALQMKQFTVHNVKWLTEAPVGKLARTFIDKGYSFDYISDAQLTETSAKSGALVTKGGNYKVLVVPATRRMPVATLQRLAQLAKDGAKVIFEKLPEDVPGYGRLESRRAEFKQALASLGNRASVPADLLAALNAQGVSREPIAETGINFIRRANAGGHDYFITNLTAKKLDQWVALGTPTSSAVILDPLTGGAGTAALRAGQSAGKEIYLQLAPGASLLIRTNVAASGIDAWPWGQSAGPAVALAGSWKIDFIKGGPELPPALTTTELKSWTELGGAEAKRFGGTARYRLEFAAPAGRADNWLLDLGDVREVARVRLNGKDITTAWSLPFQVRFAGAALKPTGNILELEVTNLAANRIRDMDQQKVPWKIMREINFVDINYKPFDASGWKLQPSGLLGPITLTPLQSLKL
jgi:hypothetical protein